MTVDTFTSWRAGVSPEQMREIDRMAESDYGIAPIQLMEVAGLATARVARTMLGGSVAARPIVVLAGPGNNGGDGLVAARRLHGWGAKVTVVTSYPPEEARGLSKSQVAAVQNAGIGIEPWLGTLGAAELMIDAILGFGAQGEPRRAVAEIVREANRSGTPILALDVPSGIDSSTGDAADPCVRATATVTLALPKIGITREAAKNFVGRLYLADIGVPAALLARFDIDTSALFSENDIVELDGPPPNLPPHAGGGGLPGA